MKSSHTSIRSTWITFNNSSFIGRPTKSDLFDSKPLRNLLKSMDKGDNVNLRLLFLKRSLPRLISKAGEQSKPDLEKALNFVREYRIIPSIKSIKPKCSYLKTIRAIYKPIDRYLSETLDLDLEEVIGKCDRKKIMKRDSILKQTYPGDSEIEFYELSPDLDTIWTNQESTEGIFFEMWIYHLTEEYLKKRDIKGDLHFRVRVYHKKNKKTDIGDFDILFSSEKTSKPLFVVECKSSGGWGEVYKFIGQKTFTETPFGIFICGGSLTGKQTERIDDTYLMKKAFEEPKFVDLYCSTLDEIFSKIQT